MKLPRLPSFKSMESPSGTPDHDATTNGAPGPARRSWIRAMGRGLRMRCPECGRGQLFQSYTKTRNTCSECHLELSGHQADDAPPYLTIIIVGHLVIPLALATKQIFDPPLGLQFAIWLPAIIIPTFWLLPRMKGAMVGLQWANRMHGFDTNTAT